MRKIKLHWQILIALILAIIYGLIFDTDYKVTEKTIEKLKKSEVPEVVITKVTKLKNQTFYYKNDFLTELGEILSENEFSMHKDVILKKAYFNNPVHAVSWLGDVFLRALKMLILPLILTSIISSIANINSDQNLGRLGMKTIGYYLFTSTLAILTGLFLVNIIKPGIGADLNFSEKVEGLAEAKELRDTLIEMIPDNIFKALSDGNILPVIFFAIIFGYFITKISQKNKVLLTDLFNSGFDVMMKITLLIIRFTPLGIFGIVVKVVADQDNLAELVSRMGLYMGTVLLALSIHAFITLPLILKFVARVKPRKHFHAVSTPLLTAFSTSSSGATLPLTINAVESNSGVSKKISKFTLPLGATINMDGTALYECVAAMFIAQAYGIELGAFEQIIIVVTALLASIGAAAIPMAGLIMITIILSAVGLPPEGVGLILAVDRLLDMFRTATNVWSDSCGAVIIAKSEGETLKVE